MARLQSSLGDNLAEWLNNSKCKDCKFCLEYLNIKNKSLMFKYLKCDKNHKKYFKEVPLKQFANTIFCGRKLKKWVFPYK